MSIDKATVAGRQAAASLAKDICLHSDAEVVPVAPEIPERSALSQIARPLVPSDTISSCSFGHLESTCPLLK